MIKRLTALLILLSLLISVWPASAADTPSSVAELTDLFSRAAQERRSSMTFYVSPSLLTQLQEDNQLMWYAAARGGYEDLKWSYYRSGKIEAREMVLWSCPVLMAETEEGFIAAVANAKKDRIAVFALLLSDALYEQAKADVISRREWQLNGGLEQFDMMYSYPSLRALRYEGCRYWDGVAVKASSLQGALDALYALRTQEKESFALFLDQDTYTALRSDKNTMEAMTDAVGLWGAYSHSDETRTYFFGADGKSPYYPGVRILTAVQNGTESLLPDRLQMALSRARQLARDVSGTQREKALQLHDRLCEAVRYRIDDTTDEDDCCVGALLNGEANCDGYSDAYLLLCGLCGINARLISGDALIKTDPNEAGHMWNLIELDQVWQAVDVTWDDQEDRITWTYFCFGRDRMDENYIYSPRFLPQRLLGQTDLTARPLPEYRISSWDELRSAIAGLKTAGGTQAEFHLTDALYAAWQRDEADCQRALHLAGTEEAALFYQDENRVLTFRDIRWYTATARVYAPDSEEALLTSLRQAGQDRAQKVELFLSPSLFSRFMEADNPVFMWMDLGGMLNGDVTYSQSARSVTIDRIVWNQGSRIVSRESTREGVLQALRSARKGATEVHLYLTDALYAQMSDEVWDWIDQAGIRSASVYHRDTSRMMLVDTIQWK